MSRIVRVAFLGLALAGLLLGSTSVAASTGHVVFNAQFTGEPASQIGTTLFGVKAGGAPWPLHSGSVQIYSNGLVTANVRGLTLPNGMNPVAKGEIIIVCDARIAAHSSAVAFSRAGNATVNQTLKLPAHCLAPVAFFAGVVAGGERWFAVTGW